MKNPAKHWEKRDDAERLHHCLHQISELVERGGLEILADALADSLEPDALARLANAIASGLSRTE